MCIRDRFEFETDGLEDQEELINELQSFVVSYKHYPEDIFKCRSCGIKYKHSACSDNDVSICKYCESDKGEE